MWDHFQQRLVQVMYLQGLGSGQACLSKLAPLDDVLSGARDSCAQRRGQYGTWRSLEETRPFYNVDLKWPHFTPNG